jgi:hypothetical protein
LIIKGSVCRKVNFPLKAFTNIKPKEMNIKIYKIDHTGPKTQPGGAHLGFFKSEYQDVPVLGIYQYKGRLPFLTISSPL